MACLLLPPRSRRARRSRNGISRWPERFVWPRSHARTSPESSRNSTGASSEPRSHTSEKNHTPLSPMQNSAGVNRSLDCTGGSARCGTYSACHPNASPSQATPRSWAFAANARTSLKLGTTTGKNPHSERLERLPTKKLANGVWIHGHDPPNDGRTYIIPSLDSARNLAPSQQSTRLPLSGDRQGRRASPSPIRRKRLSRKDVVDCRSRKFRDLWLPPRGTECAQTLPCNSPRLPRSGGS